MDVVSSQGARTRHRWTGQRPWDEPPRLSVPGTLPRLASGPVRIAMLAPPWISVPPPGYGGVEEVVSVLTEALVRRGHAVTLFCAPGSVSSATVVTLLDAQHPDEIERSLYEVDHVARAFDAIELAPPSPLRRHPRPLRLHRRRDGRPHRHPDRAHASRAVHRRHGGLLPPSRPARRRWSASAARSSRRRRRSSARSRRSPTRSTSAPGRCRSARTTTCCGSGG
jgi:glycosyltransferase involved in cell wall biosynthesis